ncbi:MAG: phosphotransferase [Saprospiraceae bacterium]|nr:phosphotransferase [Saprospiraceae bacterium]
MNKEGLLEIAGAALKEYPGTYSSIEFFAHETSVLYKVSNDRGEAFALKIYDNQSSQVEDNQIETLMLEAIIRHGIIPVAEILQNKQGQPTTLYTDPGTGTIYRMVLSKWLPGTDFNDQESEELFIALGKTVASLHDATSEIDLPRGLQPKIWDQVFYFRDEMAVYQDPQFTSQTTSEFRDLMDAAVELLNPKLLQIYSLDEPQLLHGDLNPWNIKMHNGQFAILDFEDAIFGPPIQDLAILLYYYQGHQAFSYEAVKNWIWQGYSSRRGIIGWKDSAIEYLIMARKVNFLNYVLTLDGDYQTYIQKGAAQLKTFLQGNS